MVVGLHWPKSLDAMQSYTTGFTVPTSNLVCLMRFRTERFGCEATSASATTDYYTYRLQTYENLLSSQDYKITLATPPKMEIPEKE